MKILLTLIFICFSPILSIAESPKLVHVISFTDYEKGSKVDWLKGKGFQLKEDAQRSKIIKLEVKNDSLLVEARRPAFGIMPNEKVDISEFTYVEVDWGIDKFPKGASYEQGVRNEAIMLIIFMGDERKASGSMFIPDSPYFVGLFLCHGDDRLDYPYVGSYFKKGGRYVCGDRPDLGELVTTRFNLLEAYHSYFDKERDDDPGISGIAMTLDTKKAGDGGKSSAFIREIRFYN